MCNFQKKKKLYRNNVAFNFSFLLQEYVGVPARTYYLLIILTMFVSANYAFIDPAEHE